MEILTGHGRQAQAASWPGSPTSRASIFSRMPAGEIVYIGKARSLRDRVRSPTSRPRRSQGRATSSPETAGLDFILTGSENEAAFLENNFVQRYQPKFNLRLKDDKSFPYLKLTVGERFPGIFLTRKSRRRRPVFRPVQPRLSGPEDHPPAEQLFRHPGLRGGRFREDAAALPGIRPEAVLGALRRVDRRSRIRKKCG